MKPNFLPTEQCPPHLVRTTIGTGYVTAARERYAPRLYMIPETNGEEFRTRSVSRGGAKRYSCDICENFDLCETCFRTEDHGHSKRFFIEKFGGQPVRGNY